MPTVGGKNQPRPCSEPSWQEGAGSLLLLAATWQTGLLSALEGALPTGKQVPARLAHARPATRRCAVLTLLFLEAVGLRRTGELKRYSGDALGLLTGRVRAYGFWQVERFLSHLARAGGQETFTDALAAWTCQLWSVQGSEPACPPPADLMWMGTASPFTAITCSHAASLGAQEKYWADARSCSCTMLRGIPTWLPPIGATST